MINKIIDSDEANKALQLVAKLKRHPAILNDPETPHDFMDPLLNGSRMVRKERPRTTKEEFENTITELRYEQQCLTTRLQEALDELGMIGDFHAREWERL